MRDSKPADKQLVQKVMKDKWGSASFKKLYRETKKKLPDNAPSWGAIHNFYSGKPTDRSTREQMVFVLGVSFSEISACPVSLVGDISSAIDSTLIQESQCCLVDDYDQGIKEVDRINESIHQKNLVPRKFSNLVPPSWVSDGLMDLSLSQNCSITQTKLQTQIVVSVPADIVGAVAAAYQLEALGNECTCQSPIRQSLPFRTIVKVHGESGPQQVMDIKKGEVAPQFAVFGFPSYLLAAGDIDFNGGNRREKQVMGGYQLICPLFYLNSDIVTPKAEMLKEVLLAPNGFAHIYKMLFKAESQGRGYSLKLEANASLPHELVPRMSNGQGVLSIEPLTSQIVRKNRLKIIRNASTILVGLFVNSAFYSESRSTQKQEILVKTFTFAFCEAYLHALEDVSKTRESLLANRDYVKLYSGFLGIPFIPDQQRCDS